MTEGKINNYLIALDNYKNYYEDIYKDITNVSSSCEKIFLKKYYTEPEIYICKLYGPYIHKLSKFVIIKKFNEIFKNNNIDNEEEKEKIINGVFCYSCCDKEGEPLMLFLLEAFTIDINRINEETGKTPLQITEELFGISERRISVIKKESVETVSYNIDRSEIELYDLESYDLESYIEKIIEDNKEEIKKYIDDINLIEGYDFIKTRDNIILENSAKIEKEFEKNNKKCLLI